MFSTKLMLEFHPIFYFHAGNIYQNPLIFAGKKYALSIKYTGILIFNRWTPGLSFLVEVARHIQSTQNIKLVIIWQCITQNVSQLVLHSILMQEIEIFYGSPVMFVVPCLLLVLSFLFLFVLFCSFFSYPIKLHITFNFVFYIRLLLIIQ